MNNKTCVQCNNVFYKKPHLSWKQFYVIKFCSNVCRTAFNKEKSVFVNCKICKKQFRYFNNYRSRNRGFYCSLECFGKSRKGMPSWNKGIHTGIIPKSAFKKGMIPKTHWVKGHIPWNKGLKNCWEQEKHPRWKGGKTVSRGYIYIKNNAHRYATKNGYVLEHRLMMEKHIGRYLEPQEIVHHINENIKDNRIENLMLLPNRSAHREYHRNIR